MNAQFEFGSVAVLSQQLTVPFGAFLAISEQAKQKRGRIPILDIDWRGGTYSFEIWYPQPTERIALEAT